MKIINNEQKMLDIIFAKRNKSYGAYALRSAYGSTLFRSLFIVFVTVATSAGLAHWLKDSPIKPTINDIVLEQDTAVRVIVCKIDPPKVPDQPVDRSEGGSTTSSETATLINEHTTDTTKQTVNTDPQPTNTATTAGTGSGTPSLTGSGSNTNTSGGGGNNDGPNIFVDESPEFEGGHAALLAFIKKHLVYPGPAADVGKQGTLYVKFVVDESGKVSNILLQNNLGYGLDDEAMRVVKMIPKFKSPGKVQGKPVKTYYQIPIKFKLG
ncbi:MAG: energy transducer TonB [Sphingobacteriaceae bacterium]|nr:energy transducer TonB [Sphingobacteriaceae bacterium]